jgi:CubicO group peptidase (beta-lactamase class C family)
LARILTCVVWLIESANATAQQMIESFAYLRPSARVKTRWQYNNIAYSTASHLPEQLFGGTFVDFVRDNVWEPLGMTRSYYDIQSARSTSRLANGFGRRLSVGRSGVQDVRACLRDVRERHGVLSDECRGKEQVLGWYTRQWRGIAGAGGVITCSKDMVSWAQARGDSEGLEVTWSHRSYGYKHFCSKDDIQGRIDQSSRRTSSRTSDRLG